MTHDSRAPEAALAALHGAFASHLAERLKSGEATAADLNCIRQFLKDNGIDCIGTASPDLGEIVDSLPTFSDTEGMDLLN